MFKSARWKSEKNKFKAVFKLHFHASQLEQVGGDALVISLIPADVGKPTMISEKAAVRDGSCYWENPVYETVMLFQEPKSGKIYEKMYYFVILSASSKSGLVGEVSVDFASYANSSKPSSVSLPLKNTKCSAILHVSIQKLPEDGDQRDAEENEIVKIKSMDRSLMAQFKKSDADLTSDNNSTEDGSLNSKIPHTARLNGNQRASSGSDLTMSSSESSSDLNAPVELLCPREVISEDKYQDASETVIEKLKTELMALSRVAEVSELELQSLRKRVAKESKRGQDLSREVVTLKEERDAFKGKCEKLMDEERVEKKSKFHGGDPCALVEELRQELIFEKDLNANLRLQLEKTQESYAELVLAVRDLDKMVEEKDKEIFNLSNGFEGFPETKFKSEMKDDEGQTALEELVLERNEAKELHEPDKKSMEVYSELERCRREKDDLEIQMEQLSFDYEILKQEKNELSYLLEQSQAQEQLKMQYECSLPYATVNELESQIENLETELKKQSNECLEYLATVTKLETDVKDLEEEMENQAERFEADLEILIGAKVEQEQRAIRAEAALKKMQWQNLNTAERFQNDLRRVSVEVEFTLEANERTTIEAVTEANELRLQKRYLEELVWKAKEEIQLVRDQHEAKLNDMELEIENGKKHGEETHRVLSQEILILKAEIERLETENSTLSDEVKRIETLKDELEQTKASIEEKEMLLTRGNGERNDLEGMIALMRKDAEKLTDELNSLRSSKDQLELLIGNLQAELNTLKSKRFEDEFEKEELRNQVCQLKSDLNKVEGAFSNLENQLKDNETSCLVSKDFKGIALNGSVTEENPSTMPMIKSCDEVSLGKVIEASIFSTLDEGYLNEVLKEMELLREKNTSMEGELQQMQERFTEMSLKFAEVEGERQRLLMTRNRKNAKKGQ